MSVQVILQVGRSTGRSYISSSWRRASSGGWTKVIVAVDLATAGRVVVGAPPITAASDLDWHRDDTCLWCLDQGWATFDLTHLEVHPPWLVVEPFVERTAVN